MKHLLPLFALLGLAGCGGAMNTPESCAFVQEADVPIVFQGQTPTVEVMINGTPTRMILDTGAKTTLLTKEAALRAGVPRDSTLRVTGNGVGAQLPLEVGNISLLEIAKTRKRNMLVPVLLAKLAIGQDLDGLLGEDVLSDYDLDIDFPHSALRLYRARNCPGGRPNWAEPASALKRLPGGQALPANRFRATLDGTELNAMLDTGATDSAVEVANVLAMGVTQEQLNKGRAYKVQGVAPDALPARAHRFSTLVIGDETVRRPTLIVSPLIAAPPVPHQLLLGMDYLRTHRVWISYASFTTYVARSAGGQ